MVGGTLVAAVVGVAAAITFAGAAGSAANVDHAGSESLIAFARSLETPNGDEYASHIYVVRPDGTGLRALTRGSALDGNPAWSPDGMRIAFDRQEDVDDFDLCIMNANGSGVRCLGQAGTKPAWSADGKRLAYAFGGDIYVIGIDGNGQRKVAENVALDSNDPAWAPDGKTIAFDAYRGLGKAQVYLLDVKRGRLRRLTHSAFHLWEPAWSPAGTRIAVWGATTSPVPLLIVDLHGTVVRTLRSSSDAHEPAWSPDGRQLAFANWDIFATNIDGTDVHRVTRGAAVDHSPVWRPS